MELAELRSAVSLAERRTEREVGELRALLKRGKDLEMEISKLEHEAQTYERASVILTSISEKRQDDAQDIIESLVTQGLQSIFGDSYSFHVVGSTRGKSPVVDFMVRTDFPNGDVVQTPVMESRGGGLAVIVGFLLRLVVVLLSNDRLRRLLVLDETFAHVSEEYRPAVAELLRAVVEQSGVQLLLVTHDNEFAEAADVCYRLSQDSEGFVKVSQV